MDVGIWDWEWSRVLWWSWKRERERRGQWTREINWRKNERCTTDSSGK